MLSDAVVEKNRGRDVVAGYIEPHGRADTEALIPQFETIPMLSVEYRGVEVKEFDLEASLLRHPEIILVDELAHTNPPGGKHAKRWLDVLELVDAGIDVHTTLNIQHLESLKDVVASITGVQVRETVPDSILKKADKIELIDIPPDELIQRLKEGKIYSKERIAPALQNFFQEGNLLALREITLRKAAEKIDAQMLTFREQANVEAIWQTTERVLVAIAPSRFANRLVRAAARIALSKHAELIVVFVETPRYQFLRAEDRQLVEDALLLAQQMDASVERRTGTDVVQEILDIALKRNVTLFVVGKPIRGRIREHFSRSVADDLIRRSGSIDVHLITGDKDEATTVPVVVKNDNPFFLPLVGTAAIVAIATAICFLIFPFVDPANLVMVYMLAIVGIALLFGRTESVVGSILCVVALDFFFVAPRFSLSVKHAEYLITLVGMLITGLVMSTLTLRIRLQSRSVAERERRTHSLYELGRQLVRVTSTREVGDAVKNAVFSLCKCDVALLTPLTGQLVVSATSASGFENEKSELAVAEYVFDKNLPAGRFTDTLPGAVGLYWPVSIDDKCYGVLCVKIKSREFDSSFFNMLTLISQLAAFCLERNAHNALPRLGEGNPL